MTVLGERCGRLQSDDKQVERGETIIITRHGRPIARIVPEASQRQREIDEAIDDITELAKHSGKITVDEILSLIREGRKY